MASGKEPGESGYMVPELRVERERSSLVLEELTNLLDTGEAVTEIRRRMCELDWCSCANVCLISSNKCM